MSITYVFTLHIFHTLQTASSPDGGQAAIEVNDLTGDEIRCSRGQEDTEAYQILGLADSFEWNIGNVLLKLLRIAEGGFGKLRFN